MPQLQYGQIFSGEYPLLLIIITMHTYIDVRYLQKRLLIICTLYIQDIYSNEIHRIMYKVHIHNLSWLEVKHMSTN